MIPVNWREIKKEYWIVLLLVGILIMTVVFPSEKDTGVSVLTTRHDGYRKHGTDTGDRTI